MESFMFIRIEIVDVSVFATILQSLGLSYNTGAVVFAEHRPFTLVMENVSCSLILALSIFIDTLNEEVGSKKEKNRCRCEHVTDL